MIEEKLDGANAGISLAEDGRLRLQSRGHVLTGGARESHFDLFKQWAHAHEAALAERLVPGMTLYGEWLYAKHTIFYDELPHYFLEFDIRDRHGHVLVDRAARARTSAGAPVRLGAGALGGRRRRTPRRSPRWSRTRSTSRRAGAIGSPRPPSSGVDPRARRPRDRSDRPRRGAVREGRGRRARSSRATSGSARAS